MMNLPDKTSIFEAVFTILLTVAYVRGKDGCKVMNFLDCEKNKTFTGHVIKSFKILAPGLEMCQHYCYLEDQCVSYNLNAGVGMVTSCELNDADHWILPGHMVPKNGSEYCPIKNPCSSSPCPPNRFCTPDFSWDTFTCEVDPWAQWTSWTSWSACHLPECPITRTRNCTTIAPPALNNGASCSGPEAENKGCQIPTVDTTGCESPLGMEDRSILDSQITASSMAGDRSAHSPQGGRLNNVRNRGVHCGAWIAKSSVGEYIEIDLGSVKKVTKIATQGRPIWYQWVREYSMSYSNDANSWTNYQGDCVKKFPGNTNRDSIVIHKLEVPIIARHIRVIVQQWESHPAIRMELYGCTRP